MADAREARNEYATILGPDAKFKGELSFDSAAKVQGCIEGSIRSKGKVLVADGASCKASVSAREIEVEGHVEGNVEASERIEIKGNGRITGDIISARMSMADGAAIDGHVRIGLDARAESKAAASVEPKVAAAPQHARAQKQ
jgi:cytoskeletal protein CcmA (bactofilin family)